MQSVESIPSETIYTQAERAENRRKLLDKRKPTPSGPRGRWFESSHSDEKNSHNSQFLCEFSAVFCFYWIYYCGIPINRLSMPVYLSLEQSHCSNGVLMKVHMAQRRECSKIQIPARSKKITEVILFLDFSYFFAFLSFRRYRWNNEPRSFPTFSFRSMVMCV